MKQWFKRSGERVSIAHVKKAKEQHAHAKRFGYPVSPHALPNAEANPGCANVIEKMTLEEYARFYGRFNFTVKP